MTAAAVLLLAGTGLAADIQVSASVDRTEVVVGEPFRFTVVASGASTDIAEPRIPQVQGLEFYGAGRSQSVNIVNGQVSSSITFQYQAVARIPGRLVMPSVAIVAGGRTYATDPIQISAAAPGAPQQPGAAAPPPAAPPVFVTGTVNKRRVFVGEQLNYTFRMHYRTQLASQPRFAQPDFSGFVTEDLGPRQSQANAHGTAYNVSEVRIAIFPTAPGDPVIGPATLQVAVVEGGADPFAMFFGSGRTMTLRSDPIQLTVLPLPDSGKPAGFTGAVGSYRISASLDKDAVEAGKPVTLTVEVSGRGLVKSLREPAWPEFPGMRRYETLTSLNTRNTGDVIQGSKTFKVMLIPSTSGKVTIPPVRYPVFDPEARKYLDLATPALTLRVKPAPAGSAAQQVPAGLVPAAGVRTLGKDIRFLKAEAALTPARGPVPALPRLALIQLLPLLFALSGAAAAWRRAVIARDPAAVRARRALRSAVRILAGAAHAAKRGDALAVHCAVQNALAGYLADKWGAAPSGLTLLGIQERLRDTGTAEETVDLVVRFWEEADLVRYAPTAASDADLPSRLAEARDLLAALEKGA